MSDPLPRSQLRPYQEEGVRFLQEHDRALLLMDMGTGKTITTLTDLASRPGERALVVGTKRICESVWMQEAADWDHTRHLRFVQLAGMKPAKRSQLLDGEWDVALINYENLVWLCETHPKVVAACGTLVLDEISHMKNTSSRRFKKFRNHVKHFPRRRGLTGTPVPNKLLDLFGVTLLMDDGQRFGRAITPFKEQWFHPVDYHRHQWAPNEDTEEWMFSQIEDLCYRVESADLPPINPVDVVVTLPPLAQARYNELDKHFVAEWDGGRVVAHNAAEAINKLQQVAQGRVYDEDGRVLDVHTAKLDALVELIEELQGQPLLVGYTYQHDATVIQERVPQARLLLEPEDIEDWNRGEVPVMLVHPKSAGHGLNLQHGGSHLALYGLNWSLELYSQLAARLARPGQREDSVTLFRFVAAGTIDEEILFSVTHEKWGRQERFFDAVADYRHRHRLKQLVG